MSAASRPSAAPGPRAATRPTEDRQPTRLSLPAPAKLNLFLHVTGRRPDGYHLLETVFQFVDLADTIDLSVRDDGQIRRTSFWADVPEADDLAVRAARALREACGCRLGVDIAVTKRIPTGAGLGGGSSDAASVLLGLNRLWGLGLTRDDLQAIGLQLGADVPVFVAGANAYATGIGEQLRPVALPTLWYVLAMPPVPVGTASVFAAPELTRDTIPLTISGFSEQLSVLLSRLSDGSSGCRSDLGSDLPVGSDLPGFGLPGRNDLEPVVMSRFPAVADTRDRLQRAVARAVDGQSGQEPVGLAGRVRMTGSGACVFAVASSRAQADRIAVSYSPARTIPMRTNPTREPGSEISEAFKAGGPAVVVAGLAGHPLGSRQVG